MLRSESDTALDNAFANGTKRNLRVLRALQYWALAVFRPTRHAFGGHYSNVGSR